MHDRAHQKTAESCKGRRNAGEAVLGRALLAGSLGQSEGYGAGLSPPQNGDPTGIARQDGPEVARAALKLAKAGNVAALRLVMERLLPPSRRRTVSIDLPKIVTPADVPRALAAVTAAVGRGELPPDEGAALGSLIGATRQALELAEIDARLRRLEEEQ